MAKIANVETSDTFSIWRIRSNAAFDRLSQFAINNSLLYANTVTANNNLNALKNATITKNLTVSGNTTLGAAGKTITSTGVLAHTGNLTISGNTTFSNPITYGGVTLSNSVTGTGSMVLATALTSTNTALRTLIADRLQVANAAAIYQTKAIERAALANTNASISNVKTGLTSTNTALRTLIADRLQVANAATIYQTKSIERAALANTNASISNVKTGLTSTNTALRTLISDNTFGYKNRIINGDMRIDQRNAGATKQITATNDYTTDRWRAIATGAGRMDFARSTSTPPTGFSHFLRMTVGVADNSLTSTDEYFISQRIEGFNIADLLFGSASAKAVTLSFWVRSSLTGAFSGALRNAAGGALNRSYPFSYTISAASTWEQKTVTLTADTSGTWTTDASIGVEVCFCVGAATGQLGTANAWTGPTAVSGVTGTTNVMATVSNTFDLTGVQLEKGTVATGFDVRSHQQELALCQRYFCKTFPVGTAPVTGASSIGCLSQNGRELLLSFTKDWRFPVTMRASPTVTTYSLDAGQTYWKGYMLGSTATSNVTNSGDLACLLTGTNQNGLDLFIIHATAAAEL